MTLFVRLQIAVFCQSGIVDPPSSWPSASECLAECAAIAGNPVSKGFADPGAFLVLQGDDLTLTCQDPDHYREDDWNSRTLTLTCLEDATLDEPDTWHSCTNRYKSRIL